MTPGSPVIRALIGVAAVVLAVVIVWALLVPGTDWLARHDIGSAKGSLAAARDAARGRLLTLGAGLLAAGALVFTARNFILSREGQVTDRYTKAIEQLGSDKSDVRIGGIFALERIARDSAKDHPTVMEVLTVFIRDHSREPLPPPDRDHSPTVMEVLTAFIRDLSREQAEQARDKARAQVSQAKEQARQAGNPKQHRSGIRPDVQAAVSVIRRRDAKRDLAFIDLADANLAGANLIGADLTGANLRGVDLTGANLTGADLFIAYLTGADLTGADLTGADLFIANLDGAHLDRAHLDRAHLDRAHLRGAHLERATLTGDRATLTGATLTGADLSGAHLTDADLAEANLAEANLAGANLAGANLDRAKWPEGAQVPVGWMVDSVSGRLQRAGQLSEVMTHYFW